MAEETQIGGGDDHDLFTGEDKRLELEVLTPEGSTTPDIPVDIAGWSIQFVVREKEKAPLALIDKAATIEGVYSATRSANTQRAVVTLTDDDLAVATFAGGQYRHAWKRLTDGAETVLAFGVFHVERASQV